MRLSEYKSQVFTSKTIRNLNQNDFDSISSDKSFVQQPWLLIDCGRNEDNCYMCL